MAKRFAQQLATLMVFFLVAPTVVLGQEQRTAAQDLEDKLAGLIHRIGATSGSDAASMDRRKSEAGFRRNLLLIALALTARTDKMRAEVLSKKHFQDVEAVRVDEQVGGSDANSGSTSLVSKGGIPTILGLAVENGALMRSESGTTITFRGNPVGIVEAFRKQGFSDSLQDLPETAFLRRLSFAFSFDTSRGDSAGMLIGDRQQLSSYSFRYEILNRRDPRHPAYKSRWEALTATKAQTVTD